MTEEERAAKIIEAHQELVGHIERGARRMRTLSAVTVVVATVLLLSYATQLLLPLTGETSVTVNLADPALQASEVLVVVLALLWLYVGVRDFAFASRLRGQIRKSRSDEKEIERRISGEHGPEE
jgi:protein-S-isoprenylcysteine O-methyltransferase Ste14